jgi:DNA processing protein
VTDRELETAATVALVAGSHPPTRVQADELAQPGGAVAALEARHGLLAGAALESAVRKLRDWAGRGITVVTAFDERYPANLRTVVDRPAALFVRGGLRAADAQSVAVVGTRRPSPRGTAATRSIVSGLVMRGYTIASGLAAGIDTAAHSAALAAGGRTVAVVGTGVDRCYPPQNSALQREIASRGAVISCFPPGSPPTRRSFPIRNAVMSGLALATVIVEATPTSGTRIQARASLAQGRPLLMLERLLDQEWAAELATRRRVHVLARAEAVPDAIAQLLTADDLLLAATAPDLELRPPC